MKAAKLLALFCGIAVLANQVSFAKDNIVGIYGIVDRVVLEPAGSAPERVQIWGVFVVPMPMSSGDYKPPQRGVLYFSIPGREESARKEWAELKTFAGTGQILGFTQYWVPNPKDPQGNPHKSLEVYVHQPQKLGSPEVYPLGVGILKINDGQGPDFEKQIVAQLRDNAVRR
jgi:hypothetical protein